MSFTSMKKGELIQLATEDFGIELPEKVNVPQILAILGENGVTWAMAVEHSEVAKPYAKEKPEVITEAAPVQDEPVPALLHEPESERPGATITTATIKNERVVEAPAPQPVTAPKAVLPEKVLLRMDRENGTFQIRGYKFTRQHPYALVGAADAEYIVENVEGFYYATPKEAQEFYG